MIIKMLSKRISVVAVMLCYFGFAWCGLVDAAEFKHSFGAATPGEPGFVVGFDIADKSISLKDGLRVTHKAAAGQLDSRGVKTVFGIRGNGSAILVFDAKTLGTPDIGWGSGLHLRLEFADDESHGLTIALQAEKNGREYVMVDYTTHGQDQHEVKQWPIGNNPFSVRPSSFRATRTDETIEVEALVGTLEKVFYKHRVPIADIFPIGVWIGTGGAVADLDVTAKRLTVTGVALPTDTFLPPAKYSLWVVLRWACLIAVTIGISLLIRKTIRG